MKDLYPSSIRGKIEADEVSIGQGVVIEEDVLITGKGGPARKVRIGDFVYIGRHTRIICPEFCLGDYTKLNAFSFAHGDKPLQIGRNCWFGGSVVLDSMGGLDIDDNVGIGAHSQVWTHIQFGDIVEGSRFYSNRYMHIGKDAWLVGHCILSPVEVGERSMAMVGSVITRDMLPNHIYAGVPAKDVSDKLGYQFEDRSVDQKAEKLLELVREFEQQRPEFKGQIRVVTSDDQVTSEHCCFNVADRTYSKRLGAAEVAFLKAYVPLIKFTPRGEGAFFKRQDLA